MHKGIFITGTDTGVGKTFVTAGILTTLNKSAINACPMKPVETGCKIKNSRLVPEDTLRLIQASGVQESIDTINPYRFRHALASAAAAELEGITIKKKKIISCYNYLLNKYQIIVVEGTGGIMVPVYKKYLILDLIKDLSLPLIIVSRPGLGTINHTLLTIGAAKNRGISILGVIINYSAKTIKGLSEKTNPAIIENLSKVPVLGVIPYLKGQTSFNKHFNTIIKKILKEFKRVNPI